MTGITQAALAERNAEAGRNKALAEWRAAWWETTMVLAAVPVPEAKAAVRSASVILGHTEKYLNDRRRLGLKLAKYALPELAGLPPRLALLYVLQARADPGVIREVLEDAQRRELSLRDLARELRVQPDSWQRQGEREQARITHTSEAAAVIAALDALGRAVTAFAAMAEPADPSEVAEVAARAQAVQPSVNWLAALDQKASAA